MDTAAAQWPQEIVVKPMEEIVTCPKPQSSVERKVRPQKDQALNCPRCNSTNTKFCYYNNYSLSQPRYFCKTCRRYWTEGGSLRNIPVGGGSRKNKRSASSGITSSLSAKKLPDLVPPPIPQQNPNPNIMDAVTTQDLNLGFSSHNHDFKSIAEMIHIPNFEGSTKLELQNNNPSSSSSTSSANSSHHLSSLELLTGLSSTSSTSRGLSPFAPLPTTTDLNNSIYSSSGFSFNPLGSGADHHSHFKPSLNFSLDGLGSSSGYSSFPETTTGKPLFPFEDLKQVSSGNTSDHQNGYHHHHQPGDSTGYWNGMMGGGHW